MAHATVVFEERVSGEHTIANSSRWKSRRTSSAHASRGTPASVRPTDARSARASAVNVCTCSVTVQALHMRSRSDGSAGCSESFQSPWP